MGESCDLDDSGVGKATFDVADVAGAHVGGEGKFFLGETRPQPRGAQLVTEDGLELEVGFLRGACHRASE